MSGSKLLLSCSWLFFLTNPFIAQYGITLWKDILFSGAFLVFCTTLVEITLKSRQNISRSTFAILTLSGLASALLRSNASLVVLAALVIFFFAQREARRIILGAVSIIVIGLALISFPISSVLNVQKGHFAESVSLPLEQISYTILQDGNITDNSKEFLEKIRPLNKLGEAYRSNNANAIKFSPNFNDAFLENHKAEFIFTWIEIGIANPGDYIHAWIDHSKVYWNVFSEPSYCYGSGYNLGGNKEISHNLASSVISKEQYAQYRNTFTSLFAPLFNIGTLVWIALFALLMGLLKKDYGQLLCLSPFLLMWLTYLIAAPAGDFRYMFSFHLALPLLAFLIFRSKAKTDWPDSEDKDSNNVNAPVSQNAVSQGASHER